MTLLPFHAAFPERAKADARALLVRWPQGALPKDDFVLVEHFCALPGCDCRRVVLGVIQASTRLHVATIEHAFEPAPEGRSTLAEGHPQSSLSDELLALFVDSCASDPRYRAQVAEHYRMWRERVEGPLAPRPAPAKMPYPPPPGFVRPRR